MDKRRQTATIYWVDSQANFPEPIRIDTQKSDALNACYERGEYAAAAGWKVRYTIVDS